MFPQDFSHSLSLLECLEEATAYRDSGTWTHSQLSPWFWNLHWWSCLAYKASPGALAFHRFEGQIQITPVLDAPQSITSSPIVNPLPLSLRCDGLGSLTRPLYAPPITWSEPWAPGAQSPSVPSAVIFCHRVVLGHLYWTIGKEEGKGEKEEVERKTGGGEEEGREGEMECTGGKWKVLMILRCYPDPSLLWLVTITGTATSVLH